MKLKAKFDLQKGDFKLNIDFDIPIYGITGILGPSGCGKTTLLRLIAGLERVRDGELVFADTTWQRHRKFVPSFKRQVGYVFQENNLFPHLNVSDNLKYGMKDKELIRISFEKIVEAMELQTLLKRKISTLSGGERQRVSIGQAILSQPKLLLMDEPLSALDEQAKSEILPYIKKLPVLFDTPIIYVSHSKVELTHLSDRIYKMARGNLARQTPPRNVEIPLTRASVIKVVDHSADRMTLLVEVNLDVQPTPSELHH